MVPATLPPMTHWRGDLWRDGYRQFGPILDENDAPPAEPCRYCRIQFRNKQTKALGYELNSAPATGQGEIQITNPTSYQFVIPEQALPLAVGVYVWDFETYTAADKSDPPLTWFTGEMTVLQDVSHD